MSASPESNWDQAEMPLTEHLRELRRRLIISVSAVFLFAVALFVPSAYIIRTLANIYFPGIALHAFGPTDVIGAEFRFSLYGGIVAALPVIVYQTWFFLVPAIHPRTRRLVYLYTAPALFLAIVGIAFCHMVILPRVIGALLTMTNEVATPTFGIAPTINLILALFLAFALIFQTPLILTALVRMGLITTTLLNRYRRHILLGTLIVGGIAAPDGSPLTMLLLAAPLYALYEISLLIIYPLERLWHSPSKNSPS